MGCGTSSTRRGKEQDSYSSQCAHQVYINHVYCGPLTVAHIFFSIIALASIVSACWILIVNTVQLATA